MKAINDKYETLYQYHHRVGGNGLHVVPNLNHYSYDRARLIEQMASKGQKEKDEKAAMLEERKLRHRQQLTQATIDYNRKELMQHDLFNQKRRMIKDMGLISSVITD